MGPDPGLWGIWLCLGDSPRTALQIDSWLGEFGSDSVLVFAPWASCVVPMRVGAVLLYWLPSGRLLHSHAEHVVDCREHPGFQRVVVAL